MGSANLVLDTWAVVISFGWLLLCLAGLGLLVGLVYLIWVVIRDRTQ